MHPNEQTHNKLDSKLNVFNCQVIPKKLGAAGRGRVTVHALSRACTSNVAKIAFQCAVRAIFAV